MSPESLISFIPVIGCAMIIFVHAAPLYCHPQLHISREAAHKCFICAYLIFAFHYLHTVPGF